MQNYSTDDNAEGNFRMFHIAQSEIYIPSAREEVCGARRRGGRLSIFPNDGFVQRLGLIALTLRKYGTIDRAADPKRNGNLPFLMWLRTAE